MDNNGPYKKSKAGKFQISFFKFDKVLKKGNTIGSELVVDNYRVCIQHSRFSNKDHCWQRQQIWCSTDELRDLANALDDLTK